MVTVPYHTIVTIPYLINTKSKAGTAYAVSSSEVAFQVAKRVLDAFDFAVALERMDERAARKLSGLLGTTVSFPHHRARAGASGGFNRRAAAVPTSIRDRILREHDVDVRLHAWLAARPLP